MAGTDMAGKFDPFGLNTRPDDSMGQSLIRIARAPAYAALDGGCMHKSRQSIVVYIVDDDNGVRGAFARLLRAARVDARPFSNASEFLAEVVNMPGACILLDITMPLMSGLQVQEGLRSRGIVLPVITISARDDAETRGLARSLGAGMFLSKPVDGQALLDAIDWVTGDGQPGSDPGARKRRLIP